jgi:hypothetical protein
MLYRENPEQEDCGQLRSDRDPKRFLHTPALVGALFLPVNPHMKLIMFQPFSWRTNTLELLVHQENGWIFAMIVLGFTVLMNLLYHLGTLQSLFPGFFPTPSFHP